MTQSQPSWIGHTIGGRYKIEELLGQGGMSAVYKGTDPNLHRTVAIKLIHPHLSNNPEFVRRFEQEAAAVAQLRHPNIIQVYDFANDGDVYYMVLEYVPGETLQEQLAQLMDAGEQLDADSIARIMASVSDAVAYAHDKGMIHRDLKPANVMIRPNGEPILMDFGVAKMLGGAQHTATGAVIGTALYMAPEQVRGERPDERADIYSLGVMLFETVAGRRPFDGDSAITIMMKHVNEPVPDVRTLRAETPEQFVAVIEKAMAKAPEDRFQTAAEMAAALRAMRETAAPGSTVVEAQPESTVVEVAPEATVVEPAAPATPEAAPPPTAAQEIASGAAPPPEPVVETPPEPVVKEPPPVAAEAPTPEAAASPAEDGKSRRPLLIGGAIGIGILLCVVVGGFISVTQFLGGDATPIATQVAEAGEPAAIEATDVSAAPTAAAPTEAALPTETPTEAPTETPIPTEIPVPEGMALVPAGSFRMGSTNGPVNEQPEHPVFVDAFYMDLYEITNGQFAECLNGGVCTRSGSPAGGDDHPVVNISWDQAQAYCSWAGKRLPTEAEWEYAAGGPDDRVWPWGNEFDAALSAASAPSTQPVGSYPDGVSPFGIFDMAGNVVEWVADVYVADFFANSSPLNPLATGTAGQRVYRGGSYGNTDGSFYTTSRRYIQSRSFADTDVGFRCALDAPVGDPEARDVAVADFCTAYVDEGWSDTCP